MKNSLTVKNENGEEITLEIILNFKIEEYGKNYVAYTLNDDGVSETVNVCISEIEYLEDVPFVKSIPEEEVPTVVAFYNHIKNNI